MPVVEVAILPSVPSALAMEPWLVRHALKTLPLRTVPVTPNPTTTVSTEQVPTSATSAKTASTYRVETATTPAILQEGAQPALNSPEPIA